MNNSTDIDYGPLKQLLGIWVGDKGQDVAPEEDGVENNDYYETITYTSVGDVTNAESQELTAIHYHQVVMDKADDEPIHDQTGYWLWDAEAGVIMHSLAIPRGVSLIAGGTYNGESNSDGSITLNVSAAIDDEQWKIIQSPFMSQKAETKSFVLSLTVSSDQLSYDQTTMVDIYDKMFEHTDKNCLTRKG